MKKASSEQTIEYIQASETNLEEDLDMAFALLFEEVKKRREGRIKPDVNERLLPSGLLSSDQPLVSNNR